MKKILAFCLCILMLASLCGCAAQSAKSAPAAYEGSYMTYDTAAEEAYCESAQASGLAMADTASYARGAAAEKTASNGAEPSGEAPETDPAKLIYSADVTVETTDFDGSLGKVDELVARFDGWIESSSINGANYSDISRGRSSARSAYFALRIPGERFDELIGSLTDLGNVPYSHVYTENVTAQYYDVQARMNAYRTQEARLLEMMEVAEDVEDIILLEDRLTEIRYQIESLQSTLNNWDRRVSYSSVYLQLNEVREYTPDTPIQLRYGERLSRAFRDGLSSVGSFFREFLLWFVEALPTLMILAVLLVVLLPLGRKLRRNGKARREARRAAKAEKEKK